MFLKHPNLIETEKGISEWSIPVPGLEKPLVLDTHFLGMTPLNDVERETHKFDCVAVSGLASHPLGSWQPKREDRSFMWIRDELPRAMPDTRFSIYGYDTTLVRSNSFQSIEDLATSLIDHIKASVLALSAAKPLVFLAHSLGGIVLKEAFVALANGYERSTHILNLFQGGVFFGVPSQGMATSHLLAMVKGQVNEQLVHDLSMGSEYLRSLDDRFSGLALLRDMCLYWAYETKTSPTVIVSFILGAGPEEILVLKESATRSLYSSRTSAIFPINNNHSEMVKFSEDDPNFRVVVDKLRVSCSGGRHRSDGYTGTLGSHVTMGRTVPSGGDGPHVDLMKLLEFPDYNGRFETIEESFEHTCEWVFDVEHGSLSRWLKDGESFFWIHGKPGSGKSTLMKFIVQHRRTWELLHKFSSEAVQIHAIFLFHDRGTPLQKSFEGLLRSLLFQIIDKLEPYKAIVAALLKPLLDRHWSSKKCRFRNLTINDLESCIAALLQQNHVKLDMFFLLDALDEYDGQPDFICGFIKELMKMTNSPNKLKILFSSRPWETFHGQFVAVPSIRVQDFTKGDIETYCWGIVDSKGEEISIKLGHIIPAVINRADGVFLWVKLVLLELANEALRVNDSDGLTNILNSIPSDLHEYYARTVQRIPERLRWDAYVILEVLSTNPQCIEDLHVERSSEMMMAVLESTLSGANESRDKRLTQKDCAPVEYTEGSEINLSIATGNLAEVVYARGHHPRIQFAHQTAKEFVRGQYFKRFVLGHRARQTRDNAYTFMAKYYLTNKRPHSAIPYLILHEKTTGCSLKDFLDSIPKEYFSQMKDERSSYRLDGRIAFSIYSHQRLYLEETLRRDPDALRKTQEKLLSVSCPPRNHFDGLEHSQEHAALLHFVLEHGYTIEQDRQAFRRLMQEQIRFRIHPFDAYNFDFAFLELDVAVLIEHGQDPNIWITTSKGSWICSRRFARKRKAIHLAKTRELARCLLDHGAQINGLDSAGNTPLDCLLRRWSLITRLYKSDWSSVIHQTGILLIEHGAITKTTTRKTWERYLSGFQADGLDITPFRECLDRIRSEKNIRERTGDLVATLRGWVGLFPHP
ncbi:hypothetical protein M434DRAFT_382717 [Hypoxylon sp. CO27-5]|nr:hypothetical protein M434DRAFT_382717 [Hypoxylon sp. CO27-5]